MVLIELCGSQGAVSMLTLLVLVLMPVVWAQPYPIPPTCYMKVLSMGKEITQRATDIKRDHDTYSCTAHLPDMYIDVHNACVMSTMNSYLSMLGGLRERRCAYTRKVQALAAMIRQLYIIISQKCHGELVFTRDNCAALEHRGWRG
ncbi:CYTL1 domain-containing protein [Xyrauchen texanus]|uniref:CYTL1 domain-containing protein n=1 Tax=Xyrauchen texanus TaxID=154827 RepID=UPI002241F84A|nr:CYTL1 domain-containing protein [Xyrauchen texanus]